MCYEVTDIDDVLVLHAVARSDRKLHIVDPPQQHGIEAKWIWFVLLLDCGVGDLEIDETAKLIVQKARRLTDRFFAVDRTIGLDREDQTLVVKRLAEARVLDSVAC